MNRPADVAAPPARIAPEWSAELDRRDGPWWGDLVARVLVFAGGISAILFIVAIFGFIASQGIEFALTKLDWGQFFGSDHWRPAGHPPEYGVLALVAGTGAITAVAMLVAVPFSFGAALYVGEFAHGKQREWLKVLIELLAAIPSVVWGVIGLYVLSPLIIDLFAPSSGVGVNVLNAGLILGLMAAPIMTTIAEDALRAVPDTYREAAESLGATRWQVIRQVVLVQARPGLSAAVLLGIGRAFGETIAVWMASGQAVRLPTSIFDPVQALTATIAAELGETAVGSDHYQVLFVLGVLLFLITFVINLVADRIVRGARRKA